MVTPFTNRVLLVASMLAWLTVAPCVGFADDATPASAWQLRPYVVRVLVAIDPVTRWPNGFEKELIGQVQQLASQEFAGLWQLDSMGAPLEIRQRMLADLDSFTADNLPADLRGGVSTDKLFLLTLAPSATTLPPGYQVAVREFDLTTQLWNVTSRRSTRNLGQFGEQFVLALRTAFAPLARIESVDDGQATICLRGAAMGRQAGHPAQLMPGQVLRPVIVDRGEDGQPNVAPQPTDWTWLVPQADSGLLIKCRVQSGLSGASLPEYHPRRLRLALAVTPPRRSTTLQLISNGKTPQPLSGCDIFTVSDRAREFLGRTDSSGRVTVAPATDVVRNIAVHYGEQTLARVPIVPGLVKKLQITCSPNEARLAWETVIVDLREQLLDFVCRREGLIARNRVSITASNKLLGQAEMDELKHAQIPAEWLAALEKQRLQIDRYDERLRPQMQTDLVELRAMLTRYLSGGKAPPQTPAKLAGEATPTAADAATPSTSTTATSGAAAPATP